MVKKVVSTKVVHPGSSPDVDSDFNTVVREETRKHVTELYGEDKIANIQTLNRFGAKNAFKAMCTIYSIPFAQANKVSGMIPPPIEGNECTIKEIFDEDSDRYSEGAEFRAATEGPQWEKIIRGAIGIEGKVSSTGAHACGLIMSAHPLDDVIPLKTRQDDGVVLTQWAYPECESLGLIKMDFLGLDTVDLIQNSVTYIMKNGKTPPNMVDIIHGSMDDTKTFKLLQRGDTIGIFQLASDGVRDLLRKMQPNSIDDIAATTALYRPGPMGMLSHVRYAERKTGREELEVPVHEDFSGSPLEEILKETYNVVIYQEQVIQIANQIAGMTLQEGDDLRKAMGKKKIKVMLQMRPKFFEGSKENGYSEEAITRLWDTIADFAKYGFNKSHSYAYAINAYQAAYLKANYPVEFMAALLAQNVGVKDKILAFLKEARRMKLKVGSVDINLSDTRVSPNYAKQDQDEPDILYGFSGVNAISEATAKIIVEERNKNGDYSSLSDVIDRCSEAGVTKKTSFVNLAYAGAFDRFDVSRKGAVEAVERLLTDAKKKNILGDNLFDMFGDEDEGSGIEISSDEYPFAERLMREASVIGLYLTSHPLARLGDDIARVRQAPLAKIIKKNERIRKIKIAGSITDINSKILRKGGKSISISIDDGSGYLDANLSPELVKGITKWQNQQTVMKRYQAGEGEVSADVLKSLQSDLKPIPPLEKNKAYTFYISFFPSYDEDTPPKAKVIALEPLVLSYNGTLPIRMRFDLTDHNKYNEKLSKVLPAKIAQKWPGEYSIFKANYDTSKNVGSLVPDQVFVDAVEVMNSEGDITGQSEVKGKKNKKPKKDLREWPPSKSAPDEDYVINLSPTELVDSVEYIDTGLKTDKSKATEMAIEKFLGAENYDFGALDTSLFE